MTTHLSVDTEELARLCQKYNIRKLSLFGSILHGTAQPDSDIDLLVEFAPDAAPGFIGLAMLELELSVLLGGRTVDLRTAQDLSHHFRETVLQTAAVQYAA